jgi:hypothetical protein
LVLQQQQEEYQREGIQWEHIDYFDNMVICNLIGITIHSSRQRNIEKERKIEKER